MKKYFYLIVLVLILGLVLTGCFLIPNLVALWHFDESDGTTAPDSSGTNDGTLINMSSPS